MVTGNTDSLPLIVLVKRGENEIIEFMGVKLKNLTTLGERSATGMDAARGVLVVGVAAGAEGSKFLQVNDVILSFNNRSINKLPDLLEARRSVIGTTTEVVVFRNQEEIKKQIELTGK